MTIRRMALPGSPKKESAAAGLGVATGASAMGASATAGTSALGGAHTVSGGALATAKAGATGGT
jgi:hypothetical protein